MSEGFGGSRNQTALYAVQTSTRVRRVKNPSPPSPAHRYPTDERARPQRLGARRLSLGPTLALASSLTFGSACATSANSAPKAPETKVEPAKVEPKKPAAPAADELYQRLTAQPRAEAVLQALPGDVRELLERKLQSLSSEERRALLDPAQPYAYQRPLLHLMAGGDALGSYSALFSTSAAADELVDTRYDVGRFEDLPPVVTEVASRAARHVLARRTSEVAPGLPRKKEVLGEIAAAAEFLGDDPVYVAALSALERDYPDQRWAFMRAGALARSHQPDLAKAALPTSNEVDAGMMRSAKVLIAAAGQAGKPVTSVDDAVANARAQLQLDRADAALEVLGPYVAQEATHLGLATVRTRALAGTGPCPQVRTPLGNGPLCRSAWQQFLTRERLDVLDRAWTAGAGRDVEGVEVWLGLSHVVPMMYGLQENADQALAHLKGLMTGAKAAASVAPEFGAIELLATTLHKAVSANSDGAPPVLGEIPKATRKELLDRALALYDATPNDSWVQAAALATIAVIAPFDDSRTTLLRMNDAVRAEWRITHGSLLLWSLLASGDTKAFIANKGVLGRAAQVSAEGSYERSRWVILWAEAEAHLEPSPRSYGIVAELQQRLSTDQAPLDLRLRTAIDAAGLAARQGDLARAATLLTSLVEKTSRGAVTNRQEQDLLVTATGYEQVLRALATKGEERKQHIGVLTQLIDGVTRASAAPPAVLRWLNAWKADLERRVALETCNGDRGCERKLAALTPPTKAALDKELGPEMANLLRHGVLPVGGVELEFRYRSGSLAPQVNVDPAFLLVHMPQLDAATKPSSVIKLAPPTPPAPSAPNAAPATPPAPTPNLPAAPKPPPPGAPKPDPASTNL